MSAMVSVPEQETNDEVLKRIGTSVVEFSEIQEPVRYHFGSNEAQFVLGRKMYDELKKEMNLGIVRPMTQEALGLDWKQRRKIHPIAQISEILLAALFMSATVYFMFYHHVSLLQWIVFIGFSFSLVILLESRFEFNEYLLNVYAAVLPTRLQTMLDHAKENLLELENHPVWTNYKKYPSIQRFDTWVFREALNRMAYIVEYESYHSHKDITECESYETFSVLVDLAAQNLQVIRDINLQQYNLKFGSRSDSAIVKMVSDKAISTATSVLRHNKEILEQKEKAVKRGGLFGIGR